jgi:hypothetical protein
MLRNAIGRRHRSSSKLFDPLTMANKLADDAPAIIKYRGTAQHPIHAIAAVNTNHTDLRLFMGNSKNLMKAQESLA